jgi:hypothetical protein
MNSKNPPEIGEYLTPEEELAWGSLDKELQKQLKATKRKAFEQEKAGPPLPLAWPHFESVHSQELQVETGDGLLALPPEPFEKLKPQEK